MRILLFLILIFQFVHFHEVNAQTKVPYINNFDSFIDTYGWKHYSIGGTDTWEHGVLKASYGNVPISYPSIWATGLNRIPNVQSPQILETPFFNLSDTTDTFYVSFYHRSDILPKSSSDIKFEYSTGSSGIWKTVFKSGAPSQTWQNSSGFYGASIDGLWRRVSSSIRFLQGNDSVKFRFNYNIRTYSKHGYKIDNFKIDTLGYNLFTIDGDSILVAEKCPSFTFVEDIGAYYQFDNSKLYKIKFYLSTDNVLDTGDIFLKRIYNTVRGAIPSNHTYTVRSLSHLKPGTYYIISHHDAENVIKETNEFDNYGYRKLVVYPIDSLPYKDDFEGKNLWRTKLTAYSGTLGILERGYPYGHQIDGTHSGTKAWHSSRSNTLPHSGCNPCTEEKLIGPAVDLTTDTGNLVLNFWYKIPDTMGTGIAILANTSCTGGKDFKLKGIKSIGRHWENYNVSLNAYKSNTYFKPLFIYYGGKSAPGFSLDDIYIGRSKPDLSIENNPGELYSPISSTNFTLSYYLNNCGADSIPQKAVTSFFWSNDSILDSGDIVLGHVTEKAFSPASGYLEQFGFTKPSTKKGRYFIHYIVDTGNVVDEMREGKNNQGYFILNQENLVRVPYSNDFETQIDDWVHASTLGKDDWEWGIPGAKILNNSFSGSKAWVTNLRGQVNDMSRMHLYTPIFDLSGVKNPVLSFHLKLDAHYISRVFGNLSAGLNLSYSVDGGHNWIILRPKNDSYSRWYENIEYEGHAGVDKIEPGENTQEFLIERREPGFGNYKEYRGRDVEDLYQFTMDLKFLQPYKEVRFRYNLGSFISTGGSRLEGAMIDDFSIVDSNIELSMNTKKTIMLGAKSKYIGLFMRIKNEGNYISRISNVVYYLSKDSIFDSSDVFLSSQYLPAIRPGVKQYINFRSSLIVPNLTKYKYLIYRIDELNLNKETNERNNEGYWDITYNSTNSYPYNEYFDAEVIHGWNHYLKTTSGRPITNSYRFRNELVPYQSNFRRKIFAGQMYSDPIDIFGNIHNGVPVMYLESPSFDFSKVNGVDLDFDLMCSGNKDEGGNLEVSTNGGATWGVIIDYLGNASNWYSDNQKMKELFNEVGWHEAPLGDNSTRFLNRKITLDTLRGKSDVIFRFKYRSQHHTFGSGTPQGLRLDNFKIEGSTVDLKAQNQKEPLNAKIAEPSIWVTYSVRNLGLTQGGITKTKFYWSADSILDSTDQLVKIDTLSPINSLINSTVHISIPSVSRLTSYLFYRVDANYELVESDEQNNVGSFEIRFNNLLGVNSTLEDRVSIYSHEHTLYIELAKNYQEKSEKLSLLDAQGKIVYETQVNLNKGVNQFQLPPTLSTGIYQVVVGGKDSYLSKKILISE